MLQSEIRQVLEASCKVIPARPLREDCEKLMDDFGAYLVDTLASEMNPQVVCSVAGLCNNPAFYQPVSALFTPIILVIQNSVEIVHPSKKC